MEKRMRFLISPEKRELLPYLLCLSFLVFPSLAGAWSGVFLSNNAAQSQATYVVQFETKIRGKIDKISLAFPPGTNAAKAVLGRVMVNDQVSEDDGKGRDDHKLRVDSKNPNTLLVDLRQSRHVWPGSIVLIELFNLTNPPGGSHVLNIIIQDHRGHVQETISPIAFSTSAGGSGDITAVTAGPGLTGGGTSGDVTLGVAGPYQLPQTCSSGQVPKWNGATWACAADDMSSSGGDITAVNTPPGSGLTGGAASGDVSLSVAPGGITSAMLAPNSVDSSKIVDGSMGTADLADGAVTLLKHAPNSVDSSRIVDGSITAADVNSAFLAQMQLRVSGTCPAGQAIQVINADGTVVCQSISGGSVPNITISECDATIPSSKCNTAIGVGALGSNTDGTFNTAIGSGALFANTSGFTNIAIGSAALTSNTGGFTNIAIGSGALISNTNGSTNTALGAQALESNFTGSGNIAVGYQAGVNAVGSGNILLGHPGSPIAEDFTIRIGSPPGSGAPSIHTRTFIAGIRDKTTGKTDGVAVLIDSNGQLGTVSSSRRYKDDIRDMGEASSGLLMLRPVTFRYKETAVAGGRPTEYGLIAEEVADVYPDLVVHSATGEIETVQYHKLVPMLLNELQKQHLQLGRQEQEITQLKARLEALERLALAKQGLAQR